MEKSFFMWFKHAFVFSFLQYYIDVHEGVRSFKLCLLTRKFTLKEKWKHVSFNKLFFKRTIKIYKLYKK